MSKVLPQFGSYEAVRRLGAGGMAETFVAIRRGPGGFEQKVCIKRVLPAYAEDPEFSAAFLREAQTSGALRHANIVQVLDFGLADDSYYLALELIDGLDLRALTATSTGRRTLSPELVSLIAGELSAALEHAHTGDSEREPVVHRDVSPSNVLVSPAGEVKLTDFGIARALGGTHLTSTGVIKGKVPYLPPEYIERGDFDQRGDLFSLGVLLFELLAGERPFDGESDLDTIRRIASGERASLRELAPDVPANLAACVERLLASAPADRFGSARELLDALPPVATHAARRELGQLVEERARLQRASSRVPPPQARPAQPAAPDDPGQARTLIAPAHHQPGSARPSSAPVPTTRTRLTAPKPRRHRGRVAAVSVAGAALLALAAGAALKSYSSARDSVEVQKPPTENTRTLAPPAHEPPPDPRVEETPAPAPPAAQSAPAPHDPEKPTRAPAEVRVVVFPFGDVWIDGKALGHAPVTTKLPSGSHEIEVGDGRPEQRRALQFHAGEHQNLVFRRNIDAR